jgi:hypothetical protein
LTDLSIFDTSKITAPTFLNAKQAHSYTTIIRVLQSKL